MLLCGPLKPESGFKETRIRVNPDSLCRDVVPSHYLQAGQSGGTFGTSSRVVPSHYLQAGQRGGTFGKSSRPIICRRDNAEGLLGRRPIICRRDNPGNAAGLDGRRPVPLFAGGTTRRDFWDYNIIIGDPGPRTRPRSPPAPAREPSFARILGGKGVPGPNENSSLAVRQPLNPDSGLAKPEKFGF